MEALYSVGIEGSQGKLLLASVSRASTEQRAPVSTSTSSSLFATEPASTSYSNCSLPQVWVSEVGGSPTTEWYEPERVLTPASRVQFQMSDTQPPSALVDELMLQTERMRRELVSCFCAFRKHALQRAQEFSDSAVKVVTHIRNQHGQLRLPWTDEGKVTLEQEKHYLDSEHLHQQAVEWVQKGILCEKELRLKDALSCYQQAVSIEPNNVEYVCRLAKQWSDLMYESGAPVDLVRDVNNKAIELAQGAIEMKPDDARGYVALCVCKGRLALFSDNKTKVHLAKEAQEAAHVALDLDPYNDWSHHLMGRWHYEMANLNFVVRHLIRVLYGAALMPGTFEDALQSYRRAVSLNPVRLVHHVELGRTLYRLGYKEDAFKELETSLTLEVEDINAELQRQDAELMIEKLQKEFEGNIWAWTDGRNSK